MIRQEIDESFNKELKRLSTRTKVVNITAASFTAGVVTYLVRAGSLVASMASTLPVWHGFDPIAIFSGGTKRKKDRKKKSDTDAPKSETFFDGETK